MVGEAELECERMYMDMLTIIANAKVVRKPDRTYGLDFSDNHGRLKRNFFNKYLGANGHLLMTALAGALEIPHTSRDVIVNPRSTYGKVNILDMQPALQGLTFINSKPEVSARDLEYIFGFLEQGMNYQLAHLQKAPARKDDINAKLAAYSGMRGNPNAPVFIMTRQDPGFISSDMKKAMVETDPGIKQNFLMKEVGNFYSRFLSAQSWDLLHHVLTELGARVIVIDKQISGRAIFTRDPIICVPNKHIIIPTGRKERPKISRLLEERDMLSDMLAPMKGKTKYISADIDGGDFVPATTNSGQTIYFVGGHDEGQIKQAFEDMMKICGPNEHPFPLLLKEEYKDSMVHADFAVAALPDNSIILCPDAIEDSEYQMDVLKQIFGNENIILASEKDGKSGALNMLTIGKTLIMPNCSAELEAKLAGRGFEVLTPKKLGVSEESFILFNGGPRCLSLEIDNEIADAIVRKLALAVASRFR